MMDEIEIGGVKIGAGHKPFVIAELSGNHNGRIEAALELVDAAKQAGADAVKLQTYTADTITIDCDSDLFKIHDGPWAGRTLHDLYQEAHTPWDWHGELFAAAREKGLVVFSSPFDDTAIEFLETLAVPAYKIASFELNDPPLIRKAASKGKPLIISTGLASLSDIEEGLEAAQSGGAAGAVLLHCVSGYPSRPSEANLQAIPALSRVFQVPVGLSDHTLGSAVAVAGVSLGACVIEKHLTLRRADGGPDAGFSLEPAEFEGLVRDVNDAWAALGEVTFRQQPSEASNAPLRRSLFVVEDTKVGETFSGKNVRSIRPGFGLAPRHLPEVLGRKARRPLKRGEPLDWSMID